MEWKGIMGMIYRACEWIMLLAYINILWILFTIMGAVVFGIFPATAAMFAIIRKWLIDKNNDSVFKTFWNYYRTEFIKTNILGSLLFVAGFILFLDLKIIELQNEFFQMIFLLILFLFAITYTVIVVYIFPVFVHYDLKMFEYIKNALLIGIANPIRTVLILTCLITAYFILRAAPGLLPFFSGSLFSIIVMTFACQSFNKIERVKNNIVSNEDKKMNNPHRV
jgi:uncharacterized membrane protein YesL